MGATALEVVQRFYETWNSDPLEGSLALLDPEVEWVNPSYALDPGTRRGHAGWREAMAAMAGEFDTFSHDPSEYIPVSDDVVLCLVTFRARGRGSGAHVEVAEQHVWTVREGLILRCEWFHDEPGARRAAGLDS